MKMYINDDIERGHRENRRSRGNRENRDRVTVLDEMKGNSMKYALCGYWLCKISKVYKMVKSKDTIQLVGKMSVQSRRNNPRYITLFFSGHTAAHSLDDLIIQSGKMWTDITFVISSGQT